MIDRTSQAISFKYYQKKDEPKETLKQTVLDDFDDKGDKGHIEDSYLIDDILEPVEEDSNDDMNGNPLVVKEDIDLIETVSELVGNIESVGIDINPIFTSLLELSQRAIKNNNIDLVFKVDKLENKIRTTQYRLDEEKEKSEQLQKDFMQLFNNIAKIKEEISYFEGLSSKEKLKNINSFTEKLNYMMNQIGGVVTMTV
jgi:hypothetical protein